MAEIKKFDDIVGYIEDLCFQDNISPNLEYALNQMLFASEKDKDMITYNEYPQE